MALVVVLKQEDYDVYQEALALSQGQPDRRSSEQDGRQVRLWEVRDLTFSKTYGRPVRVVRAEEKWTEHKIVGGKKKLAPKQSRGLWVVTEELEPMVAGLSGTWDTAGGGSRITPSTC